MIALILSALVALSWGQAPEIEEGFVLRPTFQTTGGPLAAGSAFGVKKGDKYYVLTAFHLFGPPGGLDEPVAADALPGFVSRVELRDAWTHNRIDDAQAPLLVAEAAPMNQSAAHDIAIFPIPMPDPMAAVTGKAAIHPATLAAEAPKVGDPVWVAAPLLEGTEKLLPATVVEVNADWLFYELASAELDLTGTNGAPVINQAGEVVGLHLGGGPFKGKLIGSANPVTAMRQTLDKATGD